jgi:hypothetical protein
MRTARVGLLLACIVAAPTHVAAQCQPTRWGVNLFSGPNLPLAYARAQGAGFTWVNLAARWKDLQPTKPAPSTPPDPARFFTGVGRLAELDAQVVEAFRKGLRVSMEVGPHTPEWALGTPSGPCASTGPRHARPPANGADFYQFAYQLARRYGPLVGMYELWPEANKCWSWRGEAQDYRQKILVNGFDAIKAANPAALVGAPGMYNSANLDPWVSYDAGGGQRFLNRPLDVFTLHLYDYAAQNISRMTDANGYWRCTADGHCPSGFWLMEFGFSTFNTDSSECASPAVPEPGNAAVRVFEHCTVLPRCRQAFYWVLYGNKEPICDVGIIRKPDPAMTLKDEYQPLANWLRAHP